MHGDKASAIATSTKPKPARRCSSIGFMWGPHPRSAAMLKCNFTSAPFQAVAHISPTTTTKPNPQLRVEAVWSIGTHNGCSVRLPDCNTQRGRRAVGKRTSFLERFTFGVD